MSSLSGIWRSSLHSRGVFSHPRLARVARVTHLLRRNCSSSHKCVVGSTGKRNTHKLENQLHPVRCLHSLDRGILDKDTECTHLYQEGELSICHNPHQKLFSKVEQDTCVKSKFKTPPREIHTLGTIIKNNTLIPNNSNIYSTHLKTTFLLSQAPRICSTSFIRNFSSQPEDPGLRDQMKTDPELKAWLQEISKDFKSQEQPTAENDGEESISSSDSSSDSDSDSPSSESDTSSSDSDSSDSEADVKDVKSAGSPGPSSQLRANPLDPLTKVDIAGAALSDTNVDGSVHEEDELDEEDEYEDFYHDFEDEDEVMPQRHLPISLERGTLGVYDIEELITLLTDENARDICVMAVPAEHKYVDHMVIVTGRSTRHLKAMAELVRWVYKRKRSRSDPKTVKIEGEQTKDWMALDLGNIAVHMFLEEIRAKYDLETLWTVGSEFDTKGQEEELDPFALFVDQAWAGFRLEPEPQPKATPPAQNPTSMDSLAGWHGGSNSTAR